MTLSRAQLDQQMGTVLLQLSVCSTVPAAGYQPRSSSGKAGSRDLTGGDTGSAFEFARQYGPPFHPATAKYKGASSDQARAGIIEAARRELDHHRGHSERPRIDGESHDQTVTRMLAECRGDSPETISQSRFAMSPTTVRKHRRSHGLDPETGHPNATTATLEEAMRLIADGKSIRYVSMKTGVPKSTLHDRAKRDVKEAA